MKRKERLTAKEEAKENRRNIDFGLHPKDFDVKSATRKKVKKRFRCVKEGVGETISIKGDKYKVFAEKVPVLPNEKDTGVRNWKFVYQGK